MTPNNFQSQVVLLGPRGSGKTTLISAVEEVILNKFYPTQRYLFNVSLNSERLQKRTGDFRKLWETGKYQPLSNDDIYHYQVDLEMQRHGKNPGRWICRMEIPDPPGEATIGDREAQSFVEQRKSLLEKLAIATGVIVCLPQDLDSKREVAERVRLTRYFLELLDDLPADKKMPWRWVAFALTKMDVLFYQFQANALQVANEEAFTRESIEERLRNDGASQALIQKIRYKCAGPVQFAAGYTSIFGFTPNGRVNYDPTIEGLLLRLSDLTPNYLTPSYRVDLGSPVDVQDTWRPYQILDPFVFAMAGVLMSGTGRGETEPPPPGEPKPCFIEVFSETRP